MRISLLKWNVRTICFLQNYITIRPKLIKEICSMFENIYYWFKCWLSISSDNLELKIVILVFSSIFFLTLICPFTSYPLRFSTCYHHVHTEPLFYNLCANNFIFFSSEIYQLLESTLEMFLYVVNLWRQGSTLIL